MTIFLCLSIHLSIHHNSCLPISCVSPKLKPKGLVVIVTYDSIFSYNCGSVKLHQHRLLVCTFYKWGVSCGRHVRVKKMVSRLILTVISTTFFGTGLQDALLGNYDLKEINRCPDTGIPLTDTVKPWDTSVLTYWDTSKLWAIYASRYESAYRR